MSSISPMARDLFAGAVTQRIIAALALGALGFGINFFGLDLGWGAHLLVGNTIALLALRSCGRIPAMFAFSIASVPTIFLWGHPSAWAIWTAEGACLALLHRRFAPVLVDVAFWFVVGAPALFLSYGLLLGMNGSSLWLVVAKQAFNGILNVSCAEALYISMAALPCVRSRLRLDSISIKPAIISVVFCLVLLPSAIFMLFWAKNAQRAVVESLSSTLSGGAEIAAHDLETWLLNAEIVLSLAGQEWLNATLDGKRATVDESLKQRLAVNFEDIFILDKNRKLLGVVIAKSTQDWSEQVQARSSVPWARDRLTLLDVHVEPNLPIHFHLVVPVKAHDSFVFVYSSPAPQAITNALGTRGFGRQEVNVHIWDSHGALAYTDAGDTFRSLGDIRSLPKGVLHVLSPAGFGTPLMMHRANAQGFWVLPLESPRGWVMAVSTTTSRFVKDARARQLQMFEVTFAVLAIVAGGAYWFSASLKSVFRAIGQMVIWDETEGGSRPMIRYSFLSEIEGVERGVNEFRATLAKEKQDAKAYAERLHVIAKYAPIIIYSMDRTDPKNFKTEYFGEALSQLFGYDLSETSWRWWRDHIHPDDLEKVSAKFLGQDKVGAISAEYRLRTKTGSYRWVFDTQALAATHTGMGILLDITEQKEAQRLLVQAAKLTSLGEMATGMAHELNQPLNVIKLAASNLVELSRRGTLSADELAKRLKRIVDQTERAANLISHLRVFGRMPDERAQPFNVIAAIEGALSLVGAQLRNQGVKVELDAVDALPTVFGHITLFEQVVLNLLMNARDAILSRENSVSVNGLVKITVSHSGGRLYVSVIDNGGGIGAAHLNRIFEPFYTTKEVGKGTGLGLSISFGIIRDMGGEISADNVPGGARFTISLPIS